MKKKKKKKKKNNLDANITFTHQRERQRESESERERERENVLIGEAGKVALAKGLSQGAPLIYRMPRFYLTKQASLQCIQRLIKMVHDE